MKIFKQLLSLITILILALGVISFSANAATANAAVSVSSSTVKPNSQFTVTLRVSSAAKLGSVEGLMSYDASKVEFLSGDGVSGTGGKLRLSQWSSAGGANEIKFTISFKAIAEGSSTFAFESTEISDSDFGSINNVSASAKVSVVADKPLSKNNYLKSLKVSDGSLSPAFSKSVLNYTVNVPNSVTKLLLTPAVEDSTAKYAVTGSSSLKVGTNTRSVTVTAQNGDKRVYTIKIIRAAAEGQSAPSDEPISSQPPVSDEEPQIPTVFIDGSKFAVVEDFAGVQIPEGFEPTVTTLGEREVMAITDNTGKLTMLCLADEEGIKSFFIYNKTDISYYPYMPISINGSNFISLPKPQSLALPDGFTAAELTIADKVYGAFKCDDQQEFYLMYLFNAKGETLFYLYDSVEGTLQRYIGTAVGEASNSPPVQTKPIIEQRDSLFGKIGLFAVVILSLAVIALSVLIIVLLCNKQKAPDAFEEDSSFDDDFVI